MLEVYRSMINAEGEVLDAGLRSQAEIHEAITYKLSINIDAQFELITI